MRQQPEPTPGVPSWDADKTRLTLPSDSCSDPTNSTSNVHFHSCFAGGRQMFLQGDGVLTYVLTPALLASGLVPRDGDCIPNQWQLCFCVCTVHRAETDLQVTLVSALESQNQSYNVSLPYTKGEWQTTEPVLITLDLASRTTMSITRAFKQFGIAIKEITLTPIYKTL